MKNAVVVLGLGSALVLALAAHRSAAGEASDIYDGIWQCQNGPIQQTAYFSGTFEGKADRREVQGAYTKMLATRYGYQGQANCGVATSRTPEMLAKLKDDQANYIKQLREAQVKVVETGWVFAGASAAAPVQTDASEPPTVSTAVAPVATAMTAPQGPTKLWVCRGNANAPSRDMYITKPFAAGYDLTTQRKMHPALARYMQANYSETVMTCDYFNTQAEADKRVAWLVNWAHTYKFDPVSVSFTYP
ncbi:MAG: hypothetical protein ACRETU_06700 [Steroidobacterales bacterium]